MKEIELSFLRKRIDQIDWKILQLLNERMEIALRIRKQKKEIFDPERERKVIENVTKFSRPLLSPEFSRKLYCQIMDESRRLQEKDLRLVGFQGEHGAFSEVAAQKYDPSLVSIPCKGFKDVFEEVETGRLDFGIVPVENSIEGGINEVEDLLIKTDLRIAGEVTIPVHHALLSLPETDHRQLKIVYSHPHALAQCREFLARHRLEARPFYDTAGAAKMLSEERPEATAVIANRLCAELYGLEILNENIEDNPSNFTRFVVLSRKGAEDGDKCSIIFSVVHEAGALFRVLKIFADEKINLTRITSRPEKGSPGKYVFLTDFEGSLKEERITRAIENLLKKTVNFKFLGCYPSQKGEPR